MSIVRTYPFPFYSGTASVSADVPSSWPVALNARNYMIDIASNQWRHQSIPMLRQQADQSESPAEASLNPEMFWRRAQDDFQHGAGQAYRDRPNGDPQRYRSSKGIDPWTPYQFSLLPDTDQKRSSANTNLNLCTAGSRLYATDGASIVYTTDITPDTPTWTSVTGLPATNPISIASDGFNVYSTHGANGVYKTDTSTSASASFATGTVSGIVSYVNGRLMVTNTNSIYNVIAAGALPAALFSHPNTNFSWVGFAGGPTQIYMAGYSGDKSLIYKTAIKQDATALDAPTVAGQLPDGEIITAIDSYLGYIFLGTSKGVRFCQIDNDGGLVIGAPIDTITSVRCFEGQGRFVWFGWTNYDSTSTGLGRLSLQQFTETPETGAVTPAYASDLMVAGQSNVLTVVTFQDIRVLSISGLGIYAQTTTLVATGTLDTGFITFGLPDPKVALFVDVNTLPLSGSYSVSMSVDGDTTFDAVGLESASNSTSTEYPTIRPEGEKFELRFTLTASGSTGPTITRWTLKAVPGATDSPAEYITVPFLLHRVLDVNGREEFCDVQLERNAIKELHRRHSVVLYQEADNAYDVVVDDYVWIPYQWSPGTLGFGTPDGTMVAKMKRIN